ncbi:MAG: N-acetylglutaminylglutamine amidotransferase [Alphaproteobacteria bacterium]
MCGIAGELRFDDAPADSAAIERMAATMAPRGPDAQGLYAQAGVAFGHRRLRIIDLSAASAQPLVDPSLGLAIVFNGCIYNYKALRRELGEKGYRFFSQGDTEVLLKAWHAWGPAAMQRLHGMFAFAIWERESGRVTLGRDRLGIKPLYLARDGKRLRFASTLPALLAGGGVDTTIDRTALAHYMSFHAVVPAPRTLLAGVEKLPPATLLTVEADGSESRETWWDCTYGPRDDDKGRDEASWRDEVLATLRRAVERRLEADVPVGVLLSGGLDSSLIVALLAEAGQHDLRTFSIGFEAVGGEAGDEFEYSDIVARRFGTDHRKIFVPGSRALDRLDDCIGAMSEPMVSHDCIGFYLLSEEVSKGVRVVQSGQGADEIFAGYHWYPPMLDANDPVAEYARVFFDADRKALAGLIGPSGADPDAPRDFVAGHFAAPGAERPVDKALRLDSRVMLTEDPVKRVDNMTMAWGLEARVPFLDHEVVELAARIPAELKVAQGGKHILKEAGRQVLPAAVIDRPKGYFPVPALKYLRGPFLERVQDALTAPAARRRGLFDAAAVEKLLADPEANITPLGGSRLWQVALLECWLQKHNIGAELAA